MIKSLQSMLFSLEYKIIKDHKILGLKMFKLGNYMLNKTNNCIEIQSLLNIVTRELIQKCFKGEHNCIIFTSEHRPRSFLTKHI